MVINEGYHRPTRTMSIHDRAIIRGNRRQYTSAEVIEHLNERQIPYDKVFTSLLVSGDYMDFELGQYLQKVKYGVTYNDTTFTIYKQTEQ
jgi:hypothetical protein